jgi:ATP-dependent Lon protease
MEIATLSGYTEYDKQQIAQKFLVPKEQTANGLGDVNVKFNDESLRALVRHYTKEAGVRSLEREIASVFRKVAREFIKKGQPDNARFSITPAKIEKYLGPHRFTYGKADLQDIIGTVNGLAVTAVGGDLLSVEAAAVPSADKSSGKLIITGMIKQVMEESGHAAMTYVRSRAEALNIDETLFSRKDIHVHVLDGAIPKDGPSAGITMATAMVSALTGIPVRGDVAMTGEISLQGRVLPIGGVKEKLIAAHRGGIKKVLIPKKNEKDLRDVPEAVLKNMEIVCVEHVDEVLRNALKVDDPDSLFKIDKPLVPSRSNLADGTLRPNATRAH